MSAEGEGVAQWDGPASTAWAWVRAPALGKVLTERASGHLGERVDRGESLPGGLSGGSDDSDLALLGHMGSWDATAGPDPGEGGSEV